MSMQNQQTEAEFSIKSILAPLVAIIVGLFMVILDGTAMNVVLKELMDDFKIDSFATVQWTVTGYMLAQAAVIPLAGWLSDRYGSKEVFLTSVALFTIGSLLCGFATSIEMLVFFRVLQGIGGGMVAPIAMAYTYRLSPPSKVGAVMGMMGIPILLAPALGPVLAGYMVDYVSWHWIFFINIPIGIIGVIIGLRTLPKIERSHVASLDIFGLIFGPIAFAALSYGVVEGGEKGWTAVETLTGLIVGGIALIVFIIAELNHRNPLLELRVFKSFEFTKGILVQWIMVTGLFGTLFLFPYYLIAAHGFTAFKTGLVLLPQALTAGFFMPIGGKLFDKFGARPVVMTGMALVTTAAILLSNIGTDAGVSSMILPLCLLGAGMGLAMMPINTHIIQAAPRNLVSRVTSLTNAAQQVISSLAIAVLTTILGNRTETYLPTDAAPTPQDILSATAKGFADTFVVVAVIAAIGMVLGIILKRLQKPEDGPEGEKQPEAAMMMH